MIPSEQPQRSIPGGGRWAVFLAVVAAIAAGFGISLLITGGDDDESPDDGGPTTGISVSAELAPAEDAAVALAEAANRGDCDAIRSLAVERVANLLIGELNCIAPSPAVIDVVSSDVIDEDPVVVAITLADGEERLVVEVEMVRQGNEWVANEFDAAD